MTSSSRQWSVVSKNVFCFAFSAMLVALFGPAHAQQPGKVFRIGFLDPSTASGMAGLLEVFRQELNKLGWIASYFVIVVPERKMPMQAINGLSVAIG
jgi:hypothetical protein